MQTLFNNTQFSKSMVKDLTNILMGSSKSIKIIRSIWTILKYMELNVIGKDLMDELLKLFVVIYLKSGLAIKVTLYEDLENAFMLIKEKEDQVIVD
jgi:hypothetical protein